MSQKTKIMRPQEAETLWRDADLGDNLFHMTESFDSIETGSSSLKGI